MEFNSKEAYVHDMSHVAAQTSKTAKQSITRLLPKREKSMNTRPEVHVTTEHITMAEFPWVSSKHYLSFRGLTFLKVNGLLLSQLQERRQHRLRRSRFERPLGEGHGLSYLCIPISKSGCCYSSGQIISFTKSLSIVENRCSVVRTIHMIQWV
jgi:hypothetical protein